MEKENNMQEQVNKAQMETPRKKQRETAEVKTERKNAFDGFVSRVNLTKERRQDPAAKSFDLAEGQMVGLDISMCVCVTSLERQQLWLDYSRPNKPLEV